MSLPEAYLWQALRRRPNRYKFRRQHPFELYVADFYCAAAKLVVEIDGASHGIGITPGGIFNETLGCGHKGFGSCISAPTK